MWSRKKNKSFHISSTLYNVVNNFDETSIKECTKMDKLNEKIYVNLLKKADKAQNNVKNSSIYMTIDVPPPPRPSNRDKLILWTKRNITRPVIEQTEAVIFLYKQGLRYDNDYEAYQAIDLAKQYKKELNIKENYSDKSTNFDTVYTANDKNIMRKRSIKRVNRVHSLNDEIIDNSCENEHSFMLTKNVNSVFKNVEDNKEYDFDNIKHSITEITTIEPSAPPLVYPKLSNPTEIHV